MLAVEQVIVVLVDLAHTSHSLQLSIGDSGVLLAGLGLTTDAGVLGWVSTGLEDATATSGAASVIVLLLFFDECLHFKIQMFSLQ